MSDLADAVCAAIKSSPDDALYDIVWVLGVRVTRYIQRSLPRASAGHIRISGEGYGVIVDLCLNGHSVDEIPWVQASYSTPARPVVVLPLGDPSAVEEDHPW